MVKRFMSINTKSTDKLLKPTNLINELETITASEEVYELWSRVIAAHMYGVLIDPDTCEPFNTAHDWKSKAKDAVINREFFKVMGGLEENDLKTLALHMLNETPDRDLPYPKVSVKRPRVNYWECVSAKMWVERRKRKKCVARELHNIKPSLGL